MASDFDTYQEQERPRTFEDCAMLVVGVFLAPIAIALWGGLVFSKILKLPARLVHLWIRSRHDLQRARTGVAQDGQSRLHLS